MKDNLNRGKYPYMTNKVNLIKAIMSSCQMDFDIIKNVCKNCDIFEYCKVKNSLRVVENEK